MEEKKGIYLNMSLTTLLAVIFAVLKLCKVGLVASWSWWWVLSPIWIPLALALAISIVGVAVVYIMDLIGRKKAKK